MAKGETLSMSNIVKNIIYSTLLFITALFAALGISTYEWVEAESSELATFANFNHVPGLNKVSCGLISYCIDASGRVAECQLPWPLYNDGITSQPSAYWTATAAMLSIAVALLTLAWLYSLLACFGCYTRKRQLFCVGVVNTAALLMLIALLVWGASFDSYAVKDCLQTGSDGECTEYQAVFPSHVLERGADNIGCRICHPDMTYYSMSSTCSFGWGGVIVVISFVLAAISACLGRCVKPRKASPKVAPSYKTPGVAPQSEDKVA